MTKYVRFALPAIMAIFLFSAAATETSAQDVLRKILKRMDDNNKSLSSLKSNIKMAKLDATLNETDLSEGEVHYLPATSKEKIYVRIDWKKPVVEHLAVANGKYVLYRPKAGQAIVGTVDSAKGGGKAGGVLAFMSMSKAQLSENYTVKYIADETVAGGVQTFHLQLTPKKATSYKSADLWVDGNGMPVQTRIVEKNNDTTTVLLSDIQRNATVKTALFKITPPKGTAIVKG